MERLQPRTVRVLLVTVMLLLFAEASVAVGTGNETGTPVDPALTAVFRAASEASISFQPQESDPIGSDSPQRRQVPHLVLQRNGVLTDPEERTLVVEVRGIATPAPGVTVTLSVETQHGDPSPPNNGSSGVGRQAALSATDGGPERRIPVWQETRWVANGGERGIMRATAVFTHTFDAKVGSEAGMIPTPTDYFRYDVTVITPGGSTKDEPGTADGTETRRLAGEHAFLMESQWISRLPEVREAAPGAAPDELIVYYADMFPFRKDARDPDTWLAREEVPDYVGSELVPRMVEAFRVQTDEWGFPWYPAWTGYRSGVDAERLSVALSDGQTWFHGKVPYRGHAGISINVAGRRSAAFDTLTDGLISTFHHELFHNHQRNISQHVGGNLRVGGKEDAWIFFSEGTAILASAVGQPQVRFGWLEGPYIVNANWVTWSDILQGDGNRSYESMNPYHAAVYWHFLYEQCATAPDGAIDPAAGMGIIRRAMTILYSAEVVDITASADVSGAVPEIMDRTLVGSACSVDSYEESLAAFAGAIYTLQAEYGLCTAPDTPDGCGFFDQNRLDTEGGHDQPGHSQTGERVRARYVDPIKVSGTSVSTTRAGD